jgi:gluconate 5-dehydrogenase
MTHPQGFWEVPADGFRAVIETNLTGSFITVNLLLPGGATGTGMLPADAVPQGREVLEPQVMGPPILGLASEEAAGVHDERIVAVDFERWLADRNSRR